ncbi:MAG: AMP-binding protein [Proteobacteria bacterium]|nr:AMP-binding protein [Pseudomonadota bacterium]
MTPSIAGHTDSPSYVHGANERPFIGRTIGSFLDEAASRWPTRIAVVSRHQNICWSYAEFKQEVDRFAAGLLTLGLRPGDRCGIWSPNNAEWILTQFAVARIGVILVTINPAYRTSELEYALNKAGCRALVLAERFKSSDYISMLKELAPELVSQPKAAFRCARLHSLEYVICIGEPRLSAIWSFSDVHTLGSESEFRLADEISARLQFDEAINIQFTSGTTGHPKGATLSHHNILNNGYFVGETLRLTDSDRLCLAVPLYHCFGMVMAVLGCLTHGSAIVIAAEAFEPRAVLTTIQTERCTVFYGVPTMFIAVLGDPEFARFDLTSLRSGIMAGSPCPVEVMRKVITAMHMPEVTICYGMTETSPVSFQSAIEDPVERRVSTVGRVHPHVEVKIVDEQGRVVPRGAPGELLTRGYSVMLGYWDDAERTREAIDPAGWMHTGDLAVIDEADYCNIVGRIKDMVIRGGENIFPREVEEFLYTHPSVADVQVFGVFDPKYGEELCAWIRLREGANVDENAIRGFCEGKIARFKVPRYLRFVEGFPMTVTGKVQKFVMRQEMHESLGLKPETTA